MFHQDRQRKKQLDENNRQRQPFENMNLEESMSATQEHRVSPLRASICSMTPFDGAKLRPDRVNRASFIGINAFLTLLY
jgi:hypothetical protein